MGVCKGQGCPIPSVPFPRPLHSIIIVLAHTDVCGRSASATESHTTVGGALSTGQEKADEPAIAVLVTFGSTVIFSLIILGSSVAFNIILSITNVVLVGSYITCIGMVLMRRLCGKPLPPGGFDLGRAGPWINVAALCWLLVLETFVSPRAMPHGTMELMADYSVVLPLGAEPDSCLHELVLLDVCRCDDIRIHLVLCSGKARV